MAPESAGGVVETISFGSQCVCNSGANAVGRASEQWKSFAPAIQQVSNPCPNFTTNTDNVSSRWVIYMTDHVLTFAMLFILLWGSRYVFVVGETVNLLFIGLAILQYDSIRKFL